MNLVDCNKPRSVMENFKKMLAGLSKDFIHYNDDWKTSRLQDQMKHQKMIVHK